MVDRDWLYFYDQLQRSRRPKTAERLRQALRHPCRLAPLQRSRRPKTAESRKESDPCAEFLGFNEAAVRRRRRGLRGLTTSSQRRRRRFNEAAVRRRRRAGHEPIVEVQHPRASTKPPSEDGGEAGEGRALPRHPRASTKPPSEDGGEVVWATCSRFLCRRRFNEAAVRRRRRGRARFASPRRQRSASTKPPSEDGGEDGGTSVQVPSL